jgi:hypothetical protein
MKVLLRVIYYRNTEPLTLIWSSRFKIASIGNPWPIFYKNLRDNEIILKQSRQINTLKVYEGPALILKAYGCWSHWFIWRCSVLHRF